MKNKKTMLYVVAMIMVLVLGAMGCGNKTNEESTAVSSVAESVVESTEEVVEESTEEVVEESSEESTEAVDPSAEEESEDESVLKTVTIEVVDKDGETVSYEVSTDAQNLRGAMDEAENFEYTGSESEYGLYIESINGEVADYNVDGSYWAIYVNGEYGMFGADSQPIEEGDVFTFAYTVYVAE